MNNGTNSGLSVNYRVIECVGPYYVEYVKNLGSDNDPRLTSNSPSDQSEDFAFTIDENDDDYLRSLDPKEWKKQDHYAVLGLVDLRFKASPSIVKSAYRQKVLKHHPDKRKAKGEVVNRDEDYFTCITKAWEILGDKTKRRSYDSVDPYFDDNIPTNSEISKGDFFTVFDKYFQLNSQWSEKVPVPQLGGPDASRDYVNNFYSFWYNFESWREYSYEDEEAKESGQDRDERRWIEKQNKAVRAKRKKEEMARIRNLVDLAYNNDPRIVKFKQEDKDKKEAVKRAKIEAARAKQEEQERAQKEIEEKKRKEKEEQEAAEKARQNALKAEREAQKRALKKERKALRETCKANNYFTESQNDLVKHMEYTEKLCELLSVKELEELNLQMKERGREVFLSKIDQIEKHLQTERETHLKVSNNKQVNGQANMTNLSWSQADINLLIKAVNLFPAGTNQRWEVVANFMNQHGKKRENQFTAREVLSKAKELQSSDESVKVAANQKAFDNLEKRKKVASVEVTETSQRFDGPEQNAWTAEEQRLLEQALKTYPSNTPERWDRIADCVPNRSKKDCMKRYKDLVEMVKAKKAAEKSVKSK